MDPNTSFLICQHIIDTYCAAPWRRQGLHPARPTFLASPDPPPFYHHPLSLLSRCDDKKMLDGVCDVTFLFYYEKTV
jgi:hypothetical protein